MSQHSQRRRASLHASVTIPLFHLDAFAACQVNQVEAGANHASDAVSGILAAAFHHACEYTVGARRPRVHVGLANMAVLVTLDHEVHNVVHCMPRADGT
eukprot:363378-Chlamydomonas_euryale.AAC.27